MIKTAMERETNIPQCQTDTYHNMTEIYIHIKFTILIKFLNVYLFIFILLIPKIHSNNQPI
jgi:hypothetical protein